jgi:UDP-glucose 4-epimerase
MGDMAPVDVVVTGGAGFIGSHVVDRLIACGHRPRIYDLRPSPYHAPDAVPTVIADLRDLDRLCDAMQGCDAVIHLAAAADVDEVEAAPTDAEERNTRGTLHVLEAARRVGVGRVIYASTIWVYSDTEAALHDETLPLHPPAHLYTATKLAGELYCRAYHELYGVEHTILRFGIPFGPRARPAAVIPAFVSRALAGEPLTIAGDGRQSRRFVYVDDLADGVVRALAPVAANRVYNVVGTEDVTIARIAQTVARIVGDVEIRTAPGRSGDFAGAPVSGARAAAELGWRATTPFEEGLRRYVAWHQDDADARAEPPAPSRARTVRSIAASLPRRAGIAIAWAAAVAVMVLGLASLAPVTDGVEQYDTFVGALLVLAPLMLAGGFGWDDAHAEWLRWMLWIVALACVVIVAAPWLPLVGHAGHAHPLLPSLLAVSALIAARLPRARPLLREWLPTAGG